jgi:hypothetical protein
MSGQRLAGALLLLGALTVSITALVGGVQCDQACSSKLVRVAGFDVSSFGLWGGGVVASLVSLLAAGRRTCHEASTLVAFLVGGHVLFIALAEASACSLCLLFLVLMGTAGVALAESRALVVAIAFAVLGGLLCSSFTRDVRFSEPPPGFTEGVAVEIFLTPGCPACREYLPAVRGLLSAHRQVVVWVMPPESDSLTPRLLKEDTLGDGVNSYRGLCSYFDALLEDRVDAAALEAIGYASARYLSLDPSRGAPLTVVWRDGEVEARVWGSVDFDVIQSVYSL